jgi:hypothetical protein
VGLCPQLAFLVGMQLAARLSGANGRNLQQVPRVDVDGTGAKLRHCRSCSKQFRMMRSLPCRRPCCVCGALGQRLICVQFCGSKFAGSLALAITAGTFRIRAGGVSKKKVTGKQVEWKDDENICSHACIYSNRPAAR